MLGNLVRGNFLLVLILLMGSTACANHTEDERIADDSGAQLQESSIGPNCLPGKTYTTKKVTHYYVPLLTKFDHFTCNKMEGTCIYKKKGESWLHNYGKKDQRLSEAACKNGYGNKNDCLHPCRVLAASMVHHRYGQVLYFPKLVGMKCGNKERDGFEMIHDGYMVVLDTGSPKHFNAPGRFDFFWGRCRDRSKGICLEGAFPVSDALSESSYCVAWDPNNPQKNDLLKLEFVIKVRNEALARGDNQQAASFDLD